MGADSAPPSASKSSLRFLAASASTAAALALAAAVCSARLRLEFNSAVRMPFCPSGGIPLKGVSYTE